MIWRITNQLQSDQIKCWFLTREESQRNLFEQSREPHATRPSLKKDLGTQIPPHPLSQPFFPQKEHACTDRELETKKIERSASKCSSSGWHSSGINLET